MARKEPDRRNQPTTHDDSPDEAAIPDVPQSDDGSPARPRREDGTAGSEGGGRSVGLGPDQEKNAPVDRRP
jgi:hypothetical protein